MEDENFGTILQVLTFLKLDESIGNVVSNIFWLYNKRSFKK